MNPAWVSLSCDTMGSAEAILKGDGDLDWRGSIEPDADLLEK